MSSLRQRAARLSEKLEVPVDENLDGERPTAWNNRDLAPLPPSRRTWTVFGFLGFWAVIQLNTVGWQTASSLISMGLSVWEAMVVTIIAKFLIAGLAITNGWWGAVWHVGFSVGNRAVWGLRGSYLALAQRIMLCLVWYAVQAWIGGQMTGVMLYAIFSGYKNIPNTFPASANMTTQQFVGFIIFLCFQFPCLLIPPEKTAILFRYANIITAVTMFSVTVWALATAHGGGPLLVANSTLTTTSERAWAIIRGITTVIGSIAVSLTNQSDFNRFAKTPGAQIPGQVYSTVIIGSLVTLMGTLSTSAAQKIYGELLWSPAELAIRWMEDGYTAKARAGAFFAGFGFFISQLSINTVDNAWPGGFDLAALFPKWINIRRGAVITFILGIVINPWQLADTANTFINVLDGYSVFLGPMVGMMVCDFWIVRDRKLKLSHLYLADPSSIYWYNHGFNWRAYVSWLIGMAPALPGFINAVNPSIHVPKGAQEIFYLAYIEGFVLAFVVHYVLNRLFPVPGLGEIDGEDVFATFSVEEANKLGVVPHPRLLEGVEIRTPSEEEEVEAKAVVVGEKVVD
ncbi:NCS1 nucleoside transporter family protein [Exophiala viscosa]|uniref:NCS1 nucleoside transporter family protein n=1 Tax=Exophiala viscosa TaxID=2486360 RepID=A0AAN6DT88_9EURO|nr:NCS1 nucleoside transporter family protein [Exophiala viscosa]